MGLMLPTLPLPALDVTSHEFRREDEGAEGTTTCRCPQTHPTRSCNESVLVDEAAEYLIST